MVVLLLLLFKKVRSKNVPFGLIFGSILGSLGSISIFDVRMALCFKFHQNRVSSN